MVQLANHSQSIVLGAKELSSQLRSLQAAVQGEALREAGKAAMSPVLEQALATAPVGRLAYEYADGTSYPYPNKTYKGTLKAPGYASAHVKMKTTVERDKSAVHIMVGVTSEAFYALQWVELGKSNAPAQPWLEPAMQDNKPQVERFFAKFLKDLLDRAVAREGRRIFNRAIGRDD